MQRTEASSSRFAEFTKLETLNLGVKHSQFSWKNQRQVLSQEVNPEACGLYPLFLEVFLQHLCSSPRVPVPVHHPSYRLVPGPASFYLCLLLCSHCGGQALESLVIGGL